MGNLREQIKEVEDGMHEIFDELLKVDREILRLTTERKFAKIELQSLKSHHRTLLKELKE